MFLIRSLAIVLCLHLLTSVGKNIKRAPALSPDEEGFRPPLDLASPPVNWTVGDTRIIVWYSASKTNWLNVSYYPQSPSNTAKPSFNVITGKTCNSLQP